MNDFNLVMLSAGFEHGGNVLHRHFDGHPELMVYPFESQLGNHNYKDFLSSIERVQYRYPEFQENLSAIELYEQIIDEEMKTFLRKRVGSKFKDVDLQLDEKNRIDFFKQFLGTPPFFRRNVIEAFFKSTFKAWENYYTNTEDLDKYIGYSPSIGIDATRIIRDFPDVKIIHLIRNPFSAYRDTKRRPFPQNLERYLITWNLYHSTVQMYSKLYPLNIRIVRYEDMLEDKKNFMSDLARFINVDFHSSFLTPSWNGREIVDNIAPWGTVLSSSKDYNKEVIHQLTTEEIKVIAHATKPLACFFGYDQLDYTGQFFK